MFIYRDYQLSRARYTVGKHSSPGVDDGRKCWITLAIYMKARTAVRTGEKSPALVTPGLSMMCLEREGEGEKKAKVPRMQKKCDLSSSCSPYFTRKQTIR